MTDETPPKHIEESAPEETPAPLRKEKSSWLAVICRILFFVGAFFLIIFTILANMGGHSETLRASVEDFISEGTGYKAKVGKLNNMTFFPSISFDVQDVSMFRELITDSPAVHIDRARMSMGFWDVTTSDGYIKILDMEGIKAMPGSFLPDKSVTLDSFGIVEESPGKAFLETQGKAGNSPVSASLGLEISGGAHARKYHFGPLRPLKIKLGGLEISATVINADDPYLSTQDFKIALNNEVVAHGNFQVARRSEDQLKITGEIAMDSNVNGVAKTILKPDLVYNAAKHTVSGTISSANFNKADFAQDSGFARALAEGLAVLGDPNGDKTALDDFFKAHPLALDLKGKDAYAGSLVFENNQLKIEQ